MKKPKQVVADDRKEPEPEGQGGGQGEPEPESEPHKLAPIIEDSSSPDNGDSAAQGGGCLSAGASCLYHLFYAVSCAAR